MRDFACSAKKSFLLREKADGMKERARITRDSRFISRSIHSPDEIFNIVVARPLLSRFYVPFIFILRTPIAANTIHARERTSVSDVRVTLRATVVRVQARQRTSCATRKCREAVPPRNLRDLQRYEPRSDDYSPRSRGR